MLRWAARVVPIAALLAAGSARAGINFIGGSGTASLAHVDRIATGDLDGDGRADMVEVSARERMLAVHLAGRPDQPFLDGENRFYSFGQSPEWPAIGDLDGDRVPDVVCADRSAGGVWVLRGSGGGPLLPPVLLRVGRRPHAVLLADMDGRSGLDLVVADAAAPEKIFVLLNQGDGTFAEPVVAQVGRRVDDLLAVDVNRDGRPDIVSLNLAPPRAKEVVVTRFRGLVDGVPQFDAQPATVVVEGRLAHLLAAELSGDSAIDLALVAQARDGTADEIVILTGDGGGGFTPSRFAVGCPFFTGGRPCPIRGLIALDANRDRRTDLVLALTDPRWNGPEIWQDALQVFAGRGDGRFVPGPVFATFKAPTTTAAAQLDDDCQPDFVVAFGRNLTLQPFFNSWSPGGHLNGAPCASGYDCLASRCTDGRCCASYCLAGERCDLTGHEGTCTPPTANRSCARDADCAAEPGKPVCVAGLCCDDRCSGGRCNVPGFEGICIPHADDEPPLRDVAEPCLADDECASGVCDAFDLICCARRCDELGEFCDPSGRCTIQSRSGRAARVVEVPTTCRGDCDGDGAVSVSDVIRIVAIALGNGDVPACADQTLGRCVSIDDVIDVVNASLAGCGAPAGAAG